MVLELTNIQEKLNPLINRREVRADVEVDITPRRDEAILALSEKLKCSKDSINILRIDSNFGTKIFTIVADIYESKELKENVAVKRKKEIQAGVKLKEEAKKLEEEKQAEEAVKVAAKKPTEEVPEQDLETKEKEDINEESSGQGEEIKE